MHQPYTILGGNAKIPFSLFFIFLIVQGLSRRHGHVSGHGHTGVDRSLSDTHEIVQPA
jgi:hypothetical protein